MLLWRCLAIGIYLLQLRCDIMCVHAYVCACTLTYTRVIPPLLALAIWLQRHHSQGPPTLKQLHIHFPISVCPKARPPGYESISDSLTQYHEKQALP
ncbi:hypothetical protein L1987_59878 [Smallanthus sonchifolius]|uniref:Uncharacterized protein n=1 Tax=Smallanthus sonchifolius TaxID=185202 RepID=A0ACB9D6W1_9ASTR|nr:hypothetical protein L1987_59878 [Smallanthus sonchifolius]